MTLELRAQRPGVLIADFGLDREAAALDRDRMRRPHVEPQRSERRKIAHSQEPIERAGLLRVHDGATSQYERADTELACDSHDAVLSSITRQRDVDAHPAML